MGHSHGTASENKARSTVWIAYLHPFKNNICVYKYIYLYINIYASIQICIYLCITLERYPNLIAVVVSKENWVAGCVKNNYFPRHLFIHLFHFVQCAFVTYQNNNNTNKIIIITLSCLTEKPQSVASARGICKGQPPGVSEKQMPIVKWISAMPRFRNHL